MAKVSGARKKQAEGKKRRHKEKGEVKKERRGKHRQKEEKRSKLEKKGPNSDVFKEEKRARVGKKKVLKPAVATTPVVTSRSIVLRAQLQSTEEYTDKRGLTFRQVVAKLTHYNPNVKRDALLEMLDMARDTAGTPQAVVTSSNIADVLRFCLPSLLDEDPVVPNALQAFLNGLFSECLKSVVVHPLLPLVFRYVNIGLTHTSAVVRRCSVLILLSCASSFPSDFQRSFSTAPADLGTLAANLLVLCQEHDFTTRTEGEARHLTATMELLQTLLKHRLNPSFSSLGSPLFVSAGNSFHSLEAAHTPVPTLLKIVEWIAGLYVNLRPSAEDSLPQRALPAFLLQWLNGLLDCLHPFGEPTHIPALRETKFYTRLVVEPQCSPLQLYLHAQLGLLAARSSSLTMISRAIRTINSEIPQEPSFLGAQPVPVSLGEATPCVQAVLSLAEKAMVLGAEPELTGQLLAKLGHIFATAIPGSVVSTCCLSFLKCCVEKRIGTSVLGSWVSCLPKRLWEFARAGLPLTPARQLWLEDAAHVLRTVLATWTDEGSAPVLQELMRTIPTIWSATYRATDGQQKRTFGVFAQCNEPTQLAFVKILAFLPNGLTDAALAPVLAAFRKQCPPIAVVTHIAEIIAHYSQVTPPQAVSLMRELLSLPIQETEAMQFEPCVLGALRALSLNCTDGTQLQGFPDSIANVANLWFN